MHVWKPCICYICSQTIAGLLLQPVFIILDVTLTIINSRGDQTEAVNAKRRIVKCKEVFMGSNDYHTGYLTVQKVNTCSLHWYTRTK